MVDAPASGVGSHPGVWVRVPPEALSLQGDEQDKIDQGMSAGWVGWSPKPSREGSNPSIPVCLGGGNGKTRWTQTPVPSPECGFDSHPRHSHHTAEAYRRTRQHICRHKGMSAGWFGWSPKPSREGSNPSIPARLGGGNGKTRRTKDPVPSPDCGFESHPRHSSRSSVRIRECSPIGRGAGMRGQRLGVRIPPFASHDMS